MTVTCSEIVPSNEAVANKHPFSCIHKWGAPWRGNFPGCIRNISETAKVDQEISISENLKEEYKNDTREDISLEGKGGGVQCSLEVNVIRGDGVKDHFRCLNMERSQPK